MLAAAVTAMLSRREVLDWVAEMTGVRALAKASGEILRSTVAGGESLSWHDDRNEVDRQLAITIDLVGEVYEGGEFELRRGGQTLFRHQHGAAGGVLLFAVERGLEHRVGAVTSGGPRIVYAGWFA